MTRPSVTQAAAWRPEALRRLADSWDGTAHEIVDLVHAAVAGPVWQGAAGDAAHDDAASITAEGDAVARALVLAAVAARDGADQITAAGAHLVGCVHAARTEGFVVSEDGSVTPESPPPSLLILLSGSDPGVAAELLAVRAADLARQIGAALDRLGAADDDAARDIREAFASVTLSPDTALGNTNGVAWDVRIAVNRANVAQAIVERLGDRHASQRVTFYRSLLGEIDDPAGSGQRVDRKILAFDPDRASLVELNGDLGVASSVAVLVPGMNTTIEESARNTRTARQFVAETRGAVAAITYLGGPFPEHDTMVGALVEAASPRFALDMAPRLAAFSRDVDAAVDATGRAIPVTYIGHSYGGSIVGTAEALGLSADRTVYAAAAGAGVGVDGPDEWRNRNPDVLRFSMTAPGDPIQIVQGIPGGPHGADPDELPGVIQLATGHYDDGRRMAGPSAHSDVVDVVESDAWRNVLAVITGDRERIRVTV